LNLEVFYMRIAYAMLSSGYTGGIGTINVNSHAMIAPPPGFCGWKVMSVMINLSEQNHSIAAGIAVVVAGHQQCGWPVGPAATWKLTRV
jgi:hypothetical protein